MKKYQLTDSLIKSYKSVTRTKILLDGDGLQLEIRPTGGKYWRSRYTYHGRQNRISIGEYPAVSLAAARERHEQIKADIANGIDPGADRHRIQPDSAPTLPQISNVFTDVVQEWYKIKSSGWSTSYALNTWSRLENHVLPYIGNKPTDQITVQTLLAILRRVESFNLTELPHRIAQLLNSIFVYATITGRCAINPAANLVTVLHVNPREHRAAIVDPQQLGHLLKAIDGYWGSQPVKSALWLLPRLFCRPGELRLAHWNEIDFNDSIWSVPATRIKTRVPHIVPLSTQCVAVLRDLHDLTGNGQLIFPGERSINRPISENTINMALKTLGYSSDVVTAHGFRATARTLLEEQLKFPYDLIEHQLAHKVRDPLGRAYNRTTKIDERREMMQRWSDYLQNL